jgi:hypothetical protein
MVLHFPPTPTGSEARTRIQPHTTTSVLQRLLETALGRLPGPPPSLDGRTVEHIGDVEWAVLDKQFLARLREAARAARPAAVLRRNTVRGWRRRASPSASTPTRPNGPRSRLRRAARTSPPSLSAALGEAARRERITAAFADIDATIAAAEAEAEALEWPPAEDVDPEEAQRIRQEIAAARARRNGA